MLGAGMRLDDVAEEMNETTGAIVESAIQVHRTLGPGLLEHVYEAALAHVLRTRGHEVEVQVPIPVVFEGHDLGIGFKADMIVDRHVIVEIKSVLSFHDVHYTQLQTYLKLAGRPIGLLINFNETLVKDGIRRIVRSS